MLVAMYRNLYNKQNIEWKSNELIVKHSTDKRVNYGELEHKIHSPELKIHASLDSKSNKSVHCMWYAKFRYKIS